MISSVKFEFSRGETANFSVGQCHHCMVDERKNGIRSPSGGESFVMDEAAKVTKEESVNVFDVVGFMSANEGNMMRDTDPMVEMFEDSSSEGTARV